MFSPVSCHLVAVDNALQANSTSCHQAWDLPRRCSVPAAVCVCVWQCLGFPEMSGPESSPPLSQPHLKVNHTHLLLIDQLHQKSHLTEELSFSQSWIVVRNQSISSLCVTMSWFESTVYTNCSLTLFPECWGNEWREWSVFCT